MRLHQIPGPYRSLAEAVASGQKSLAQAVGELHKKGFTTEEEKRRLQRYAEELELAPTAIKPPVVIIGIPAPLMGVIVVTLPTMIVVIVLLSWPPRKDRLGPALAGR